MFPIRILERNTGVYYFSLNLCVGVRYLEGALVPDSKDTVPSPQVPTGRRRDYVPCADPGSRLPHMNVRVLSNFPSEVYNPVMHLSFGFCLFMFYFCACWSCACYITPRNQDIRWPYYLETMSQINTKTFCLSFK